ncbi:hypothetical protein [Roseibacillus persicicus]|uniref:Uncharacterized protein n=1 Tax=Roseibacillus persicicus TaxID=454148 RepID=A0A918TKK9_9BACT|nr:hypothetical protein [Roseibacillus persicicus]MDQ8192471.1 hypothetical protein [Roseibacillus persicicus]GHC52115.1 hypothetical protein GCM10007100_18050 [Roseibacillus persicicus]
MRRSPILLALLPVFFLLTSCGGGKKSEEPPPSQAARLDVSFDSANRSLFFSGDATTSGKFNSELPFSLWFSLAADPMSAENEASRFLLDNHGPHITQRATYQSNNGKDGQIALLGGRLMLRGESRRNGKELEGTWYFDGQPGGTFWLAPEGTIFP